MVRLKAVYNRIIALIVMFYDNYHRNIFYYYSL